MTHDEEQQIYQDNKLICKFLGYKLVEKKSIQGVMAWDVHSDISFVGQELNGSLDYARNLHFHSDWNWLMTVVERIEEMNDKDFDINRNKIRTSVNPDVCERHRGGYIIVNVTKDCPKLMAIYDVCLTFIKIYFKLDATS